MKRFAAILIAPLAMCAAVAQTPSATPPRSPAPAKPPAPTAPAQKPALSPREVVDQFFKTLQADKVDLACDALTKGTVIASQGDVLERLRSRTESALDAYGPINGYELVDQRDVGTFLVRQTYLLACEEMPLRWRFYFYRGSGDWKLIDLRVDDAVVDLVEEAGKRRE